MKIVKIFMITIFSFMVLANKTKSEDLVDSDDFKNISPKEIQQSNFGLYKGKLLNLRKGSKDYVIVNNDSAMQSLVICIYEKGSGIFSDYYERKWVFLITDWYGEAEVEFVDLLMDGKKFIHVLFEGNTGTGTMQMLDMYAGWDSRDRKFKPVFLENKDYYLGEGNDYSKLVVSKKITSIDKKTILTLVSNQKLAREGKKDFEYKWSETFLWNDENFSFYDKKTEEEKLKHPLSLVQKSMAETRLLFLKKRPDLVDLSLDALNEIKIMDCMQNTRPDDSDSPGPDEK